MSKPPRARYRTTNWPAYTASLITGIWYYIFVVRAQVFQVKGAASAEAARDLGLSRAQCVWQHILPTALRPVRLLTTLGVGGETQAGAALSFLGLGSPPPSMHRL